jgi:hypothetical protein
LSALEKTYRTLDKGLYYDSKPESNSAQLLYLKLKESVDAKTQNPDLHQHHLKVSTIIDCLGFQKQFAQMKGSGRPLSRGFLMELEEIFSKLPKKPIVEEPEITLD